jgi:hypothetical protein
MVAAVVIAALYTFVQVLEAGLAWPAQQSYQDAADNGTMAFDVWTPYDFVAFPQLPLAIAAYVITCLWLYKVRTNHEAMFPGVHQTRSRGWVWGGWVCPVVSLWFPFQIVRDVDRDPRGPKRSALIGWWWATWLVTLFSGQIGTAIVSGTDIDTEAVSALGTVETIDALLVVAAFILWFRIIRRIDAMQDQLMGITR